MTIGTVAHAITYGGRYLKKEYFFADKLIGLGFFLSLGVFRPDLVVMAAYLFVIVYLVATHRTRLLAHLALATVVAVGWVIVSHAQYGYNYAFITVRGANIFPIFGWAIGLFGMYLLYGHFVRGLGAPTAFTRFILFCAISVPLILTVETVGYHVFNIQNLTSQAYAGLPLCDCIHAPSWMQAAYLLLGPFYFVLSLIIGLEKQRTERLIGVLR